MKSSCRFRSELALTLAALAATLNATTAAAAPCCGGGGSIPSLISGDDRAQLQSSVSFGSVVGDAPAAGVALFRADGDKETTETLRLDGAYRVSDRVQVAAGLPVAERARTVNRTDASDAGLGDLMLGAAFEALPEWSYSRWKPHGFVFLQTTLPTSPSTYDAVAPFQLDARGRGFFTLGGGVALFKVISNFDFILSGEGHRSFSRTVASGDGGELKLTPGYGASGVAGAGWSPRGGALRLGLALSPTWEAGIRSSGEIASQSSSQLVWNVTAQAGYMLSDEWSASAAYIDQTLVGPAHNVSLSRTVVAALQRRWPL